MKWLTVALLSSNSVCLPFVCVLSLKKMSTVFVQRVKIVAKFGESGGKIQKYHAGNHPPPSNTLAKLLAQVMTAHYKLSHSQETGKVGTEKLAPVKTNSSE